MVAGTLAHLVPPDGRMAFVFFEGGLLPSNANGEHQTASWTPLLGISIRRIVERKDSQSQLQFVAEPQLSSIVGHCVIEISPKITIKK
jgi:hypothetical protein